MKAFKINIAVLAAALAAPGIAAVREEAPAPSACQLNIATGQKGKGYSKLFADIQSVCGARVPLCEVATEGGLQNLTTVASNQADLAFVQLDTLQDLKGSDDTIGALQAVMPLNSNLLHILARREGFSYEGPKRLGGLRQGETTQLQVNKLSELAGTPVAVVGSARALGRVLDRRYALNLSFVDVQTDEQAIAKLKAGEVAAVFSTSGWPSGPLVRLKRDSGLKLVSFDLPAQPPYQLMRKNYENLDAFNHAFLASPNLLVTRPFAPGGPNGKNVAALQACILKNLATLQEGRFEPGWQEVKSPTDSLGWPRFVGTPKR